MRLKKKVQKLVIANSVAFLASHIDKGGGISYRTRDGRNGYVIGKACFLYKKEKKIRKKSPIFSLFCFAK